MGDFCLTRKSLILRASDPKDHDAFEEFVEYYTPFISVVICKMNVNPSDSDDLRQDLLLKLWKKLSMYDPQHEKATFRGWLRTVTRNGILEFFRRKNRDQSIAITDEMAQYITSNSNNEINNLIDEEWKNHVINIAQEHVGKMFTGHAMEVYQMSIEGVPAEEIAQKFKIRVSSVYNLRSRVKEKFQQELKTIRELLEFPIEKEV